MNRRGNSQRRKKSHKIVKRKSDKRKKGSVSEQDDAGDDDVSLLNFYKQKQIDGNFHVILGLLFKIGFMEILTSI